MKYIIASIKALAAIALLALAVGCASNLQSKENMAVAAGFKTITPTKPSHVAMLAKLPPDKVTRVNHKGQVYYILPDAKNNIAYVGGAKQYQAYQQLRIQKKLADEKLEAAEANEAASMDWDSWGGWGGWGPMGFY